MAAAGAIWRRHSTDDGIHWLQVNEVGVDKFQYGADFCAFSKDI